uniref:Oxidoreductase, Gfo/Idh/MocA family/transferase hexapeptide repeat protein n=2 Tax=Candidatus Bipolaricaulota TaxID=67810 RepID=H5SG88_9BACT|nr:oxidoreductase, Gfo/Idh/MocA family/transferase hexapeptide repeat protein [uncultured Acetothermia bacterium]BAL60215.1 oxidoreductase Gfo/Idh/MocA family/transferase hexapeptide repeat protein [Candidatus Acetothermum autotrophicum]
MSRASKLAIVGVGNWGKNLLRNFCALLGEERVVACDADPQRLQGARAQHPSIHTVSDFAALLDDAHVDAVVIATPVVTHYELARRALLAGKHVFVEKPIALRSQEAQELIELAERNKRVLMVDHLLEYHPAVERLKQLVQSGDLGEIFCLYSQRLNLGVIRTEENALWSLAPHDISVMLYLLEQEPVRVHAHGACYLQKEIEDMVFVTLEFSKNILGHVHASWLDPQKIRKLVVIGSKKMAIFDDTAQHKLVLLNKTVVRADHGFVLRDEGASSIDFEDREPLQIACEHFLQCIERGEQPRSDGHDGLRVLRVLEAAQRSLDSEGAAVCL